MTEEQLLDLRRALGKFATGVTVVTCRGSAGPCGITANSFSSVSLEPALVLWSIAKVSNSLRAYLDAQHFAINVLSAQQRAVAHHFAQSDHTLFNGIDYETSAEGVPLIPGSVACFECRTHQVHDCGDHYIIIGEVQKYCGNGGAPLLFYNGQYNQIS
ncbi:MAG: flavin reductase family protein [Gammaproteobacteria bacterium]|nr:flavin reductase family protein [Gammaproteobacteria bacterium]